MLERFRQENKNFRSSAVCVVSRDNGHGTAAQHEKQIYMSEKKITISTVSPSRPRC